MEDQKNPFVQAMSQDKETITKNTIVIPNELPTNPAAESFLSILAKVILWLGIIGAIILFIVGCGQFDSHRTEGTGFTLLFSSVCLLIGAIIQWALLRVFVNISRNLFNINSALREKN